MKIKFYDLPEADLIVGCTYEGGHHVKKRGKAADVIDNLIGGGNAGGFRWKKIENKKNRYAFVALSLRGDNPDWPNEFDETTGLLKYYGDNKSGFNFLSTKKQGNLILKEVFDKVYDFNIFDIPPFFAFERVGEQEDLKFLGLAVPGHPSIHPSEYLKLYKGKNNKGEDVLNYEAYFTILDTGEKPITRKWITSLIEDNENNLIYAPDAWKEFVEKGEITPLEVIHDYKNRNIEGYNKLYYGVPGSGKSKKIDDELNEIPESQKERVLFHPDYTYSDFIGQILPEVKDEQINYSFAPGPFTKILEKAFHNPDKKFYLIIEELNRGNAPAIFGDVFQLLDRIKEQPNNEYPIGTSEYSITNLDIAKSIYNNSEFKEYGEKVRIPSNLSIIASMNTSDQNVFTLDTAFQRRWNMEMVDNDFENVDKDFYNTGVMETNVSWKEFNTLINDIILEKNQSMMSSEDKRLGVYFVNKDEIENPKLFAQKVIKYLWDDAFKFSREEVFDNKYTSLEYIIKDLKNNEVEKFSIFEKTIREKLEEKEKSKSKELEEK